MRPGLSPSMTPVTVWEHTDKKNSPPVKGVTDGL
jgi:hypothetical protein